MTAVTGKAFEMRYTVKHLMRRHGIAPAPCVVPLTAPQLHPMTLDGFASTTDLDLDCGRFRRHAFTLLPWAPLPPLLWKHDPDQIAGQIDSLAYDTDGNLN